MHVTRLFTYPVKSLAGVELSTSQLTHRGLALDRRWLLIDESGVHVTQRSFPKLVHFKVSILDEGIKVTHESDSILIPSDTYLNENIEAIVWDDSFIVREVSKEISEWFTKRLDIGIKLVFQPDFSIRKVDSRYATDSNQAVSAADGYPVLMVSEESMNHLNEQLSSAVEVERFRPNIVIKGVKEAHDEDKLTSINIGGATLIGVKNCARCQVITNNLETAVFEKEPLRTLARYRKEGNKVLFGRNFIPTSLGVITVGDTIIL